jgi:hypothetical protein
MLFCLIFQSQEFNHPLGKIGLKFWLKCGHIIYTAKQAVIHTAPISYSMKRKLRWNSWTTPWQKTRVFFSMPFADFTVNPSRKIRKTKNLSLFMYSILYKEKVKKLSLRRLDFIPRNLHYKCPSRIISLGIFCNFYVSYTVYWYLPPASWGL